MSVFPTEVLLATEPLRKLYGRVKVGGGNLIEPHLGMGMADLEVVASARKLEAGPIVMGRRGPRERRRWERLRRGHSQHPVPGPGGALVRGSR